MSAPILIAMILIAMPLVLVIPVILMFIVLVVAVGMRRHHANAGYATHGNQGNERLSRTQKDADQAVSIARATEGVTSIVVSKDD